MGRASAIDKDRSSSFFCDQRFFFFFFLPGGTLRFFFSEATMVVLPPIVFRRGRRCKPFFLGLRRSIPKLIFQDFFFPLTIDPT